jgi:vanillate O-demethylase ferredoxin subunit
MPIRQAILSIHRWTGLTVGLLVTFLAATGLAMVFRPQLQPIAERGLRSVASCEHRIALDRLVADARALHPGVAVEQLQIGGGGFGPTIVRFKDKEGVHMDPCTGAILGQRHRWAGFFNTAEELHRLLFLGDSDVSETIGGSTALAFAVLLIGGGLTLWWPTTRRALRNAFRLRLGLKGQAFDINLHRVLGASVAVVLLWQSLSALTFTFDWARSAIFAATGSPAPAKRPTVREAEASLASSEAFLRQTLATAPKANDMTLTYPRKPTDPVEIYVIEKDAPHPNAKTYLYLDPQDAKVLRYDAYAQSSPGNKVYRWLGALHMGSIGGIVGQIVLFLGVLGVPVLAFTGIRSYLRGRMRLKKHSGTAQVAFRSQA